MLGALPDGIAEFAPAGAADPITPGAYVGPRRVKGTQKLA